MIRISVTICLFMISQVQWAQVKQTAPIYTDSDCVSSAYQVYKETVQMWEQSWKWTYGVNDTVNPVTFTFSKKNLLDLQNKFPTTSGVRVYYGLINPTDVVPILALVNISGCSDQFSQTSNSILVSDANGGHFESVSVVEVFTDNWRKFCTTKEPSYTPVYAYNYDWNLINGLLDLPSNLTNEVKISLGLRSISPGEILFDQLGVLKKGSIVYVNIMFGADFISSVTHNFDFTMPCPQKCDLLSPLMTK